MKKTGTKTKVLLTLLVTLLVIGAMSVASLAADKTAAYDNKYGQIVPTDSKLEARKKSFTFYGDKANLYFMRISTGKEDANYAVEIYADKGYTQLIRSMSGEFSSTKGNTPLAIAWNFKNTESGTYYGKCYTYVSREDGDVIDTDSIQTFTIKIDRLSKKTVSLNSVKSTSKGVKITWSPLTTATKYKVMRKASGEKKWTTIQTLGKGAYTFTDSSVKSGKTYTYTVRCYDGDYKSLYNKTGLKITYLATPKLVGVQGTTSSGYAKFTWKAVSGAKTYEIYRKGGSLSNSEWKKIATVKGKDTVTYVDKTATKTDWYYTYSVRAVNGSNKGTYNTTGVDFNYMRAPLLKKAYSYTNGVKITWSDANDDVEKYYVYRKNSDGWKKIGSTTKKYYTDKTAKSGKTYTYTVKPVSENNIGAYKSGGITEKYIAMPGLGTVTFDSSNRAKVTWKKVSGADSYKVYRKINSAEEWTEIATVKGGSTVSYLDKVSKKSGYTYQYTVRALKGKDTSYYNTSGIKNMFLSQPAAKLSNLMSEEGKVNVELTWKSIKGAEGYNVYRRAPGESDFTCIAEKVNATSYCDTAVENNVKYRYAVRAVNGSAISRYTSVYIIALNRPVMENIEVTDNGTALTWSAIEGADTYYIHRKAVGGKWEVIGSYSLNSFIDTTADAVTPFCYTVSAEADGYKSDYDTVGMKNYVEVADITAQFNPATETEIPNIMVKWEIDESVESVELFKSIGDDTVSLGVFDREIATQYCDFDIAIGTEYTYTAKAIKAGKVSTEKTASAKFPHAPLVEVDFSVASTYSEDGSYITVTFSPVEFAEEYEIFRKASGEEAWRKLDTINAAEVTEDGYVFTDYDVDTEIKYYYTVKAVASDRDSNYNEEGKYTSILVPVEPVAGIIAMQETTEDGKTVAVITWEEVENGQYYKVLRKTADTEWEFLAFIFPGSELKYIDESIEQGVKYTYTIAVHAPGRGDAMNETGVDFCWELPEEPSTEPDVPTDPDAPTEPETPTEPEAPTDPEEPSTEPEIPPTTDPEEPSTEPEVPPTTDPEEPSTEPEEPTTEPEEPSTEPEIPPTTEPEEPTTEPEEPTTEPEEPTTEPEEPTTEPDEPTEPETPDGSEDVIIPDVPENPGAPADPENPDDENPDEPEADE